MAQASDITQSEVVPLKGHKLRIRHFGEGKIPILAFHGFSQNGSHFQYLAKSLNKDYHWYAPDFPGEDKKLWGEGFPDSNDLKAIVELVLERSNAQKLILAGFSLGGRIAQKIVELIPQKVDKLILLAPDGMTENKWYHWATHTAFNRWLLKEAVSGYSILLGVAKGLAKLKILKPGWLKLAENTLRQPEFRQQVLTDWPFTKNFIPSPVKVKEALNENHIPLYLFMGEHDIIFTPFDGKAFLNGIQDAHLTVLSAGHQLLRPENIPQIEPILSNLLNS